ncbi:hypothetical protein [Salipaludibacillus agaradhaerens]|uniref:hypothetical protein n=1 Tax=Salipaludibacillus agaradhaerens TaxID=76935 RepID=UPI000997CE77|nr:hypothetical protein [Salipaludibacillus agaradhaerens]
MKRIMNIAWRLANKGAKKFGGSSKDYMSESLKIAWYIAGKNVKRKSKKVKIITSSGSRKHKSWVAKINGTHPTYNFSRQFVEAYDENWTEKHFELVAGIYDVCDGGERYFIRVSGGKVSKISIDAVKGAVA